MPAPMAPCVLPAGPGSARWKAARLSLSKKPLLKGTKGQTENLSDHFQNQSKLSQNKDLDQSVGGQRRAGITSVILD